MKRRSELRHQEEMVELGRQNLRVQSELAGWCKHLQVKMTSSGLLAQTYHLPIGGHTISCDHASGSRCEAMQLEHVAEYFIEHNCLTCSHHEPVSSDNLGTRIVDKLRNKEACDGNGNRTPARRPIPAGSHDSIKPLLEEMCDERTQPGASAALQEAAKVASDLFDDDTQEFLSSLFPDAHLGRAVISIAQVLSEAGALPPPDVVKDCCLCIQNGTNFEEACGLLLSWLQHGYVPDVSLRDIVYPLIGHQNYAHSWLRSNGSNPTYQNALSLLAIAYQQNPDEVTSVLLEGLAVDYKDVRVDLCQVAVALLPRCPRLGPRLVPCLIHSLSLDDDGYDESADGAACRCLAFVFLEHPEEVSNAIRLAYGTSDDEVKELLYQVYDSVVRHVAVRWPDKGQSLESESTCRQVARILLTDLFVMTDPNILSTIAGTLRLIADYSPRSFLTLGESVLGSLALLVRQRARYDTVPAAAPDPLARLDRWGEQNALAAAVRDLRRCLSALLQEDPSNTFTKVEQLLTSPPDQVGETVQEELIRALAPAASYVALASDVIRSIYRALMNFSSVGLRGAALDAIRDVADSQPEVITETLVDAVSLLLADPYVYVHKKAVRAITSLELTTRTQKSEALGRLIALEKIYAEQDKHFLGDIYDAVLNVIGYAGHYLEPVVKRGLGRCAAIEEWYVLQELLRTLTNPALKCPSLHQALIEQTLRLENMHHHYSAFSGESTELNVLDEVTVEALRQSVPFIAQSIHRFIVDEAFFTAVQCLDTLGRRGLLAEAASITHDVAAKLPSVNRWSRVVHFLKRASLLYRTEHLIRQGAITEVTALVQDLAPEEDAQK